MSTTHRRGRTPSLDLVAGNGLINRRALRGEGGSAPGAGPLVGGARSPDRV